MFIVLFLALFPVVGLSVGRAMAWAAARKPALGAWLVYGPAIPLLVVAVSQAVILIVEAFRYAGLCSGFGDSGSFPCTLEEFLLRDLQMGLIVALVPSAVGIALAYAAFFAAREKQREKPPRP
jgi:hypothetical protein